MEKTVSIITLTTDFGTGSPYVGAMKGVILSINSAATLVDLTHDVPAQDVHHAAVVLEDVTDRFPDETIHLVVVDPGVGTDRTIVYVRIRRQHYVAPANGVLSRLVRRTPATRIVQVANSEYWLNPVSATFHGRDIMAPVVAHLSLGVDPEQLGPPLDSIGRLQWPGVYQTPERIDGEVLAIDSFGNLITNITADMLANRPTDERVCVVCGLYETWGIFNTYADQPQGTFIALIDSNGRLELAVGGDNAATRLGIQVGTPVTVAWE